MRDVCYQIDVFNKDNVYIAASPGTQFDCPPLSSSVHALSATETDWRLLAGDGEEDGQSAGGDQVSS